MGTTWTWSYRACKAIQLLATSWLTRASSSKATSSSVATPRADDAAQLPRSPEYLGQPSNETAPPGPSFVDSWSPQGQLTQDGLSTFVADELHWLLNDDSFTSWQFPGDSPYLNNMEGASDLEAWLERAAHDTFNVPSL
jgi:hypothetical protein